MAEPFRRSFTMDYDPGLLEAVYQLGEDGPAGSLITTLQLQYSLEDGGLPAYTHTETISYGTCTDAMVHLGDLIRKAMSSGIYGWGHNETEILHDVAEFCRNALEEYQDGPFDRRTGDM